MIREACAEMPVRGIRLIYGGAWFEWSSDRIIATDPIGAVLIAREALPTGLDPKRPETLVRPGLVEAACKTLDVDAFWLYRFWMGFDRGFLIRVINDKDQESRDDVSEWGIALAKELFR